MTRSVLNALKAVAVLVCITVVCVGALAVCNMYFPKYEPKLDIETAKMINSICNTSVNDQKAFDEGYIVMLREDEYGVSLGDYNKANKSKKATILAVYAEIKGINAGAYIIESKSAGRDSDIVILTAFKDGVIVGATYKKQNESYWNKLESGDPFGKVVGKRGSVDLKGLVGKTGATLSLSAIERAMNLSCDFASSYEQAIRSAISERAKIGEESGQ